MSEYSLLSAENDAFGVYREWLTSTSPFPVNIADVPGFVMKKTKLKEIIVQNFFEHVDYIFKPQTEDILLTSIAFQELLMMQETTQGKMIRRYLLLAEEALRKGSAAPLDGTIALHQQYSVIIKQNELKQQYIKTESYYLKLLETRFAEELLPRETLHGTIDVHLPDEIIELKHWNSYKHALGLLLAFNAEMNKKLHVIFYGTLPVYTERERVVNLFKSYNIRVSYFDKADNLIRLI